MNKPLEAQGLILNISAVERETGLSKDVLRMWERRYGFPKPGRDENGERQYTVSEIAKLRSIKRLMDVGMRPGKIIALSQEELNAMADARAGARRDVVPPALERDVLTMLKTHDVTGLQHTLANLLMRQGLQSFVLETITPLNRAVGESWMRGELQVFEEHLYTEQLQAALRTAINTFPRQVAIPRVLLTTFPTEQHGLGLLMEEAMLAHYLKGRADPETFRADYARLGAQRNAKIVGIFTRLWRRDGKPRYLPHIGRVWRLLEDDLRREPALRPIAEWLDRHLPAALRQAPVVREVGRA